LLRGLLKWNGRHHNCKENQYKFVSISLHSILYYALRLICF